MLYRNHNFKQIIKRGYMKKHMKYSPTLSADEHMIADKHYGTVLNMMKTWHDNRRKRDQPTLKTLYSQFHSKTSPNFDSDFSQVIFDWVVIHIRDHEENVCKHNIDDSDLYPTSTSRERVRIYLSNFRDFDKRDKFGNLIKLPEVDEGIDEDDWDNVSDSITEGTNKIDFNRRVKIVDKMLTFLTAS